MMLLYNQALPKPGDVVGRKYRIVSSIGAGGMGVVFEAIHVDTDGRVALKWLSPELSSSPEAVDRFKLEARATGRIHHPNVVAIHDIGEHEGSLYLVMELLKGSTLRARINRGAVSVYESCQVLFPVMRGVAAAHAVRVLHRDLKPDNIFLAESPDGLEAAPKVLDFGIAKLCSDSERTSPVSAKTTMMGTYQYMAFEQLHGQKDLDERVDVYALGGVLYNMLTGLLPYQADNPVDLALQMLQSEAQLVSVHVPSLSAELSQVVAKALSRDRAGRYANVDQFALALEPFASGLRYKGPQHASRISAAEQGYPFSLSTPPPAAALPTPFVVGDPAVHAPATHPVPLPRRRRSGWALGALALALGAAGLVTVRQWRNEPSLAPAPPAVAGPAASAPAAQPLPTARSAALPVTADAGNQPSHIEEWDEPALRVQAGSPEPAPALEPAFHPQPDAGRRDARAGSALRSKRGTEARPASAAPTESAPTRPPPAADYGGGLDLTELPTPSWATDPRTRRDGNDRPRSGTNR